MTGEVVAAVFFGGRCHIRQLRCTAVICPTHPDTSHITHHKVQTESYTRAQLKAPNRPQSSDDSSIRRITRVRARLSLPQLPPDLLLVGDSLSEDLLSAELSLRSKGLSSEDR